MKRIFFLIISVCFFLTYTHAQKKVQTKQEVDYVNTYIGTAQDGAGGLMPQVGPPFAMTNFSAQTCENQISRMPYVYEDTTIIGFIATHQPCVWMGDYGYVSAMPLTGKLRVLPEQRKSLFDHKNEVVSPYYYSVKMDAGQKKFIKTEMTATERCGIFKVTYPEAKEAHLVIQAININDAQEPDWNKELNSKKRRSEIFEAYININPEKNEITGYNPDRASLNIGPELKNFKGYFIIQFDKSVTAYGTWNNNEIFPQSKVLYGKKRMGAYISFSTKKNEVVRFKIASSFISLEQARDNMQKEIPDWDFEKVSAQTKDIWQKNLEKINIEGATEEQKTIFYTAYYHTQILPRTFSEYGRYYSAFDDKVHIGVSYNDYSLWDTFRALHPFLIFIQPERANEMIISMLQIYKEGGWLPMWPNPAESNIMIGTHADAVIADAYVKGIRGYDIPLAYEAMRKNAMVPPDGDTKYRFGDRDTWKGYEVRAGLSYYHSLGYIPSDKTAESVSRTLEYALDDYCIAQVAKDLGHTEDYERLTGWSKNYKNMYNKETGFMAARLYNGKWSTDKNDGNWTPSTDLGFTEGSPWTYLFCVMQDVPGLIDLMGGNEKFSKKLDENFAGNHYEHSNEPGHHYIYLYDYSGQPWKTQELARKHTKINYRNSPNGINGNDDCGQMSAWYLFSVMGFYPVTPGSGMYAIGAPQFPKITMNYNVDGKPQTLEIIANNISEKNLYIQKLTLDDKPVTTPFLSHKDITNSHKLVFEMGPEPNKNWK
jgi:predicted alpha-1,2-mannosidase